MPTETAQNEMRQRYKTPARVAIGCAVLAGLIALPVEAGVVVHRVSPLPFAEGLTLEFATHQIAYQESRYWTRIEVVDGGRRDPGEAGPPGEDGGSRNSRRRGGP